MADTLKCLGDNKKVVREAVFKMLDSWVLVLQLDKMVIGPPKLIFLLINPFGNQTVDSLRIFATSVHLT